MDPQIRNMPENFGGAGVKDLTTMVPLGFASILILGIVMLFLPRRWAVMPMLIAVCFIPASQKLALFTLDFNVIRIMVLFGVFRLWLRREYIGFTWKTIDIALLAWVASSILIYTLQQASFSALVNRLGFTFDALGMYFLSRCLIHDWLDVDTVIFSCILISVPVMIAFLVENRAGRNMFSFFGGVPAITMIREGRLRCQGAFAHPIIAGCFWVSLMPLFVVYWWKSAKDRIWAITGIITSSVIVVCCASSTPVMGIIAASMGGLFFYFRNSMRMVRWAILLGLVALHMVMNAPVWHLVSRVSAVGGSTSYFRYQLIDGAIRHFGEWAVLGTKTTAHWFWGAQDVCNQYVLEGVSGGLLTLCLFIVVIVIAFREVGKLWRLHIRHPYRLAMSWALGVSVFVHCMNFIGVSYFGQIWILWYLLLAIIGSLSVCAKPVAIPSTRPSSTIAKSKEYKFNDLRRPR